MKPEADFLRSLFEVTHVEYQTYDLINHKLVFSSGIIHKLLDYSEDEFFDISNDFYKGTIHPDDYPTVLRTINEIKHARDGEVVEMTIRARKRDGNYVWLYSRQMIYEKSPQNNICTIIREVEDVTRLMELQGQLKTKVEQLEAISYKNSHMVRSPVASIIGLVDLIEEHGVAGEHNRQIFHFLKESIVKLDDVIREINDVARPD